MDQESQDFQKVWDLELERARQAGGGGFALSRCSATKFS